MITIRKSEDRGHFDYGWLNTYHTFSFNTYNDTKHMSFRTLRVINEDVVISQQGFDTHPHKDMEIITYIVDGELSHTDSTGTTSSIKRSDVQVMTAGTGVEHSEINDSKKLVHLLQIWIIPSKKGLKPRYDEKKFAEKNKKNNLCLLVSNDGRKNSLIINQDVLLFSSIMEKGKNISYNIEKGRGVWIQVISGEISINDITLGKGDGASIEQEKSINIISKDDAELLLFDIL
jgi:redox-sensitive bicupin YhaK (pirin superfamily)